MLLGELKGHKGKGRCPEVSPQKDRKQLRKDKRGGNPGLGQTCTSYCVAGSAQQDAGNSGKRASGNEIIPRDTARKQKESKLRLLPSFLQMPSHFQLAPFVGKT